MNVGKTALNLLEQELLVAKIHNSQLQSLWGRLSKGDISKQDSIFESSKIFGSWKSSSGYGARLRSVLKSPEFAQCLKIADIPDAADFYARLKTSVEGLEPLVCEGFADRHKELATLAARLEFVIGSDVAESQTQQEKDDAVLEYMDAFRNTDKSKSQADRIKSIEPMLKATGCASFRSVKSRESTLKKLALESSRK